jgi:hypothetical protein
MYEQMAEMANMAKLANHNPPSKTGFLASNCSNIRQKWITFLFHRQIRQYLLNFAEMLKAD